MTLQFVGKTLDSQEVKTCCGELEADSVKSLTLKECGIGSKSFRRLMTAIGHCKSLEYLNLNLCNINCKERINMLAAALTSNRHLLALHLHGNEMGPEGVSAIVAALKDHPRIVNLDLGGTDMDDSGLKQVCSLLPPRDKHPGLCELFLSANPRITPRAWEKFSVAVSASSNLTNLKIDFNDIGEVAGKMLVTAIAGHKSLQRLDVESCGLTDSVGRLFVYMVQHFPSSLTYILLDENDLSECTKSSLRVSLGDSQSDQSSSDEDSPARDSRRRVARTRPERDGFRRKTAAPHRHQHRGNFATAAAAATAATVASAATAGDATPEPAAVPLRRAASTKLPTPPPPPPRSEASAAVPTLVYRDTGRDKDKGRDRTLSANLGATGKEANWSEIPNQYDGGRRPAPPTYSLAQPTFASQGALEPPPVAARDSIRGFEKVRPVPDGYQSSLHGERGPHPSYRPFSGSIERGYHLDVGSGHEHPAAATSGAATYPQARSQTSPPRPSTAIASSLARKNEPAPRSDYVRLADLRSSDAPRSDRQGGNSGAAEGVAGELSVVSEEGHSYCNPENVDVTYTFTPESPDAECSLRQRIEDASGVSRLRIMGECVSGSVQVRMRSVSPQSMSELRRPARVVDTSPTPMQPSHVQQPTPPSTPLPVPQQQRRERSSSVAAAAVRDHVYCAEKKARQRSHRSASRAAPYQVYESDCDCHSEDCCDDDYGDDCDDDDDWTPPPHRRSARYKSKQQCVSHRGRWIGRNPLPANALDKYATKLAASSDGGAAAEAALKNREQPAAAEQKATAAGAADAAALSIKKSPNLLNTDHAHSTYGGGKLQQQENGNGSDSRKPAGRPQSEKPAAAVGREDEGVAAARSDKSREKDAPSEDKSARRKARNRAAADVEQDKKVGAKGSTSDEEQEAEQDEEDEVGEREKTVAKKSKSRSRTADASDSTARETRDRGRARKEKPDQTGCDERAAEAAARTAAVAAAERNPEKKSFLEAFKLCTSNGATAISESIRKSQKVRIETSDNEATAESPPKKSRSRSGKSGEVPATGESKTVRSSKSRERSRVSRTVS